MAGYDQGDNLNMIPSQITFCERESPVDVFEGFRLHLWGLKQGHREAKPPTSLLSMPYRGKYENVVRKTMKNSVNKMP